MTMDDAVRLVINQTGWYPVSAFKHSDSYYVLVTPLADYNPDEDVVHCYYPVVDGIVGEAVDNMSVILLSDDPEGMIAASESSVSYLGRDMK